jgi:phosphatidylserine synthase
VEGFSWYSFPLWNVLTGAVDASTQESMPLPTAASVVLLLNPPAEPFEHWFYIHEWAPLIIFFGTYLGIVRNKRIPHVARYHIMMVRTPGNGGRAAAAAAAAALPPSRVPSWQQQLICALNDVLSLQACH